MSFSIPVMPLVCDIYDHLTPPPGVPRLSSPCNLAYGKRVLTVTNFSIDEAIGPVQAVLLVPALTDVRDEFTASDNDWVEVPAGSGRTYAVAYVDDLGKGFPNEHRFAVLQKTAFTPIWPTPIP